MKYRNSRTRQNFLKKFLLRMVALVLMVLAPLQLMAAPVIISTTADPTLIGTQNTVGAVATPTLGIIDIDGVGGDPDTRRLSENREPTAEKLNLAIFSPNFR